MSFINEIKNRMNTLVTFTGLGIVSFNSQEQQGEINAIRDENHSLIVNVLEATGFGSTPKYKTIPTGFGDLDLNNPIPYENAKIEIFTEGSTAFDGFGIYRLQNNFSRLNPDEQDPNDFRWILDMGQTHDETFGTNLVALTNQGQCPITPICIKNGLFFTDYSQQYEPFRKVTRNASNDNQIVGVSEIFGYIGDTVGVALDANKVIIEITFDGELKFRHEIKKVAPFPSVIQIGNNGYGGSDMEIYYKCFNTAHGLWFDLIKNRSSKSNYKSLRPMVNQPPVGKDLTSIPNLGGGGFCNPVKVGGNG